MPTTDHIVEVSKLRKEYGPLVAVRDVSFAVRKGQVVGLIGPNGAGKTTLLRMLTTLLPPTSGSIDVLGMPADREYLAIRKHVGYLPDFFNLYSDLTLEECLRFFAEAYEVESRSIRGRVSRALEYVDLTDKRNDLIRHLSRGMVQRLGIGSLLVRDPDLLLLDEPASGLDPGARIQLRQILRRLSEDGQTIIISSHILTELSEFCSHVILMDHGSIAVSGDVAGITAHAAGHRTVTVEVVDGAQTAADVIAGTEGAEVAGITQNVITVTFTGSREGMAALNAKLVAAGVQVCGFGEGKADLEDLFMRVSGERDTEAPRDA